MSSVEREDIVIYFIQCGENGPIKIGYTDNGVETRMAQLQTGCPYELRLLWVYTGNDLTESQLHKEFAHERIRGEWFRPSSRAALSNASPGASSIVPPIRR